MRAQLQQLIELRRIVFESDPPRDPYPVETRKGTRIARLTFNDANGMLPHRHGQRFEIVAEYPERASTGTITHRIRFSCGKELPASENEIFYMEAK